MHPSYRMLQDGSKLDVKLDAACVDTAAAEGEDPDCPFLEPSRGILSQFSPKEIEVDSSDGVMRDVTLVLQSAADGDNDVNALTTILGEYHTISIEKSSGTLPVRDIDSSRALREIDDPTVSVVAWIDCTELIFDGVGMGYCTHELEDGLSITTWADELEAHTNVTTNEAMWIRTELFDDSESFGTVEMYKQDDGRNIFTTNVDIGHPGDPGNDWFVMDFIISEMDDGLMIFSSVFDDEGTLKISTAEGLVISGAVTTPSVQYVSMGLSILSGGGNIIKGYMDITSRRDPNKDLFKISGGIKEIEDGMQGVFEVFDIKGVANITGGDDLIHILLTDGNDEMMEMRLSASGNRTNMELSISDPASVVTGDIFLMRLDVDLTTDELFDGVNVLNLHEFSIQSRSEEAVWLTFRALLDVTESNETHRFDIGLPELDVIAELNELTWRLGGEDVRLFGQTMKVRENNPLRADIELPEVGYDFIERLIERYLWRWFQYDPIIDIANIDPVIIDSFSNSTDDSLVAWATLSLTQGTGGDLDYLYTALDVEFDITDALNWDILLNQAYVVLNEMNDTISISNAHVMLEGSKLLDMTFTMPTMNVSMLGEVWHGAAHATLNESNVNVDFGLMNEFFVKEVVRFELNVDFDLEDVLLWHVNITEVDFFIAGMQVVYFEFDTSINGTGLADMEWLVHDMALTLFNDVWAKTSIMHAVVYVNDDGLEIGFEWSEELDNVIDAGAIISWDEAPDDAVVIEFSRLEAVFGTFVLARGTMNVTVSVREVYDMSIEVSEMYLTLFNQQVGADVHIDAHVLGEEELLDMALIITEALRPKYFMGMLVGWKVESPSDMNINIMKAAIVIGDDNYVLANLAMNVTTSEEDEGFQLAIADLDWSMFNYELASDASGSLGLTTANGLVDAWILITENDAMTQLFDVRFTATARFNETRQYHNDHSWLFHKTTHTYARKITAAHIIAKKVGSNDHFVLLHSPHTLSVDYTSSLLPEAVIFRLDNWELTLFNNAISSDLEGYALASLAEEFALGMGIFDGPRIVYDMGVELNITHADEITDWRIAFSKLGITVNDDPWASFVGTIELEDDYNHDLFMRADADVIKFPFDEHTYDDLNIHLALNVSEKHVMLDIDVFDNKPLGLISQVLALNVFTTMRLENINNFTVVFNQLAFDWNGKDPHEMDMSGAVVDMTENL